MLEGAPPRRRSAFSTHHVSASLKNAGKARPLRLARSRIPRADALVKQYGSSWADIGSNMSDNEHTAASLGHSEELSVENSPRQSVPAVFQRGEERSEGAAAVLR